MRAQKIKPHYFVIVTPPYKQDVIVFINIRSGGVNKVLKRNKIPPLEKDQAEHIDRKKISTAVFLSHRTLGHRIVCLFPKNKHEVITLFDHEKIHILMDIMNTVGMGKLNDDTEEAYAYLSEYMMDQFLLKACKK